MDYVRFFRRPAEDVAIDLLGRNLVRATDSGNTAGQIIEVGAYEGGEETASREGMKYSAGKIFLMPFRGSLLLNIATGYSGEPSCVEIRKIAFHDRRVTGSGAISRFLDLPENLDGVLLGEDLQINGSPIDPSMVRKTRGTTDNCIGYFSIKK